jgi:hypothetical protein
MFILFPPRSGTISVVFSAPKPQLHLSQNNFELASKESVLCVGHRGELAAMWKIVAVKAAVAGVALVSEACAWG